MADPSPSSPLAERFAALLAQFGLRVEAMEEGPAFLLVPDDGEAGTWVLIAAADDDIGAVVLYAVAPDDAPPERRADLLDAVNRANFGMLAGCFEVDPADGELRFRTGIRIGAADLTAALVQQLLVEAELAVDAYGDALLAVVAGESGPVEAIAAVEGGADH